MNGAQLFWAFTGKIATTAEDQIFDGAATTFTVPADVYSLHMAGIGAGDDSTFFIDVYASQAAFDQYGYGGCHVTSVSGGGGDLAWRNAVPVTPGEVLTIDPATGAVKRGSTFLLRPSQYLGDHDGRFGGGNATSKTATLSIYANGTLAGDVWRINGADAGTFIGSGSSGYAQLQSATGDTWTLKTAGDSTALKSGGLLYGASDHTPDKSSANTSGGYPVNTTYTNPGVGGAVRLIWPGVTTGFPAAAS